MSQKHVFLGDFYLASLFLLIISLFVLFPLLNTSNKLKHEVVFINVT